MSKTLYTKDAIIESIAEINERCETHLQSFYELLEYLKKTGFTDDEIWTLVASRKILPAAMDLVKLVAIENMEKIQEKVFDSERSAIDGFLKRQAETLADDKGEEK